MKIILDSNVIVAAFSTRGLCHSLFELCLDRYRIIISEYILSEVYRILHKKFKMPRARVDAVRVYLVEYCENAHYEQLKDATCRDKDDDEILALAQSAAADYIITGDKDLLVLQNHHSIPIISPREFWDIVRGESVESPV